MLKLKLININVIIRELINVIFYMNIVLHIMLDEPL